MRRGAIVLLIAALGGCGFRPLYAPRSPQDWDPDLAAIQVAPIHDRAGQILTLALRENLNPGGTSVAPRWRLATDLTIGRSELGIQRNATTIASEVVISASYTVFDYKTGKPVLSGLSRATSDYDRLLDAYATTVAGDDAQDRALHQVADEMALRLAIFVRDRRSKTSSR